MRVLLADDQAEVRSALRLFLEHLGNMSVVGEAADERELLGQAATLDPDLVLLDWELSSRTGADSQGAFTLLRTLRTSCPGLRIIALNGPPEVRTAALANRNGPSAFVSKGEPPERLLEALRSITQRED